MATATLEQFSCALADIVEGPVNLRDSQHDSKNKVISEQEAGLERAILRDGIQQPVLVTDYYVDGKPVPNKFTLVDGTQRKTIAQRNGFSHIPAIYDPSIGNDAREMLRRQVSLNMDRVTTSNAQLRDAIIKSQAGDNPMTREELAEMFNKSVSWIDDKLNLKNIKSPAVIAAMENNEIKMYHAIAISKLPTEESQDHWLAKYFEDPKNSTFVVDVGEEAKKLRKELAGHTVKDSGPAPKYRGQAQTVTRLGEGKDSPDFLEGLRWTVQLDAQSIKARTAGVTAKKELKELERLKKELGDPDDRAKKQARMAELEATHAG